MKSRNLINAALVLCAVAPMFFADWWLLRVVFGIIVDDGVPI